MIVDLPHAQHHALDGMSWQQEWLASRWIDCLVPGVVRHLQQSIADRLSVRYCFTVFEGSQSKQMWHSCVSLPSELQDPAQAGFATDNRQEGIFGALITHKAKTSHKWHCLCCNFVSMICICRPGTSQRSACELRAQDVHLPIIDDAVEEGPHTEVDQS